MTPDPKKLYQQLILQHQKAPVNFFKQEAPAQQIEAYNPICGDKFTLFFHLENGRFTKTSFHGFGCSISKAASSVLVEWLEGKSWEEANPIVQAYLEVISGNRPPEPSDPDFFAAFAIANQFPGRETCANLSWEALASAFSGMD
ncbi:MAG: Fe-S cluster assembly sulfur transfer protein SufU [Bacteroidota bacterium]